MTPFTRTTPVFFSRGSDLDTSTFYMGSIMSFLTNGDEARGRFALMDYRSKRGNEPPPHIHEWEDELYFVIEGEIEFHCGADVKRVRPGEIVFLPRGVPHAFKVQSQSVRMLILVSAAGEHPVTLDTYFRSMSAPASTMELPQDAVTYALDDPDHALAVGASHGIHILSPDDAAKAVPHFRTA